MASMTTTTTTMGTTTAARGGWTYVFSRGEVQYWRRPGKQIGHSATLGHGGRDRLYVFTSSDQHLEANTCYDKFSAYAALHCGGDHHAAARALWQQGYGRLPTTRERTRRSSAARPLDLSAVLADGEDAPRPRWERGPRIITDDDLRFLMEESDDHGPPVPGPPRVR
jgi:hypothetical protein